MKDILLLFRLLKTLKDDIYKMIDENPEMTNMELAEYIFGRIEDFKKLN